MLAAPVIPLAFPPPDPGWPTLARGNKGDQVVWLQQHLASFDPAVTVTSTFDTGTDTALRNFQISRGLPVTGSTDALTWHAVLTLPVRPVDWTQRTT
jgi:peptidoglycan hydrolase-like protein with peptidoglycan-binding domain